MEEILSMAFLIGLIQIIFIDLVLAGDNAVVIAMAAKNVPKDKQKLVILLGTAGAVLIRIVGTLLVVKLLEIPWLLLVGGILLIWISYKLLVQQETHEIEAKNSVMAAVWTIIVADATMGVDNVLAIAGAAHGSMLLVVMGLLITVPIIVWGSTLFIKWMERYPAIIYIGAGILAFTAGKMITDEQKFHTFFTQNPSLKWLVVALVVIAVVLAGKITNRIRERKRPDKDADTGQSSVEA